MGGWFPTRAPQGRKRAGFSLIELLVVIAIISILMALYLGVLSRALSKAKQVAAAEGLRQHHLGILADNANVANPSRPDPQRYPDREMCRAAYRQTLKESNREVIVTELLYEVLDEDEFEAYWYTLIDPDATAPLEFEGGALIAHDADGDVYYLRPLTLLAPTREGPYPIAWEFLSTNPANMSSESLGINVLYSDGHIGYLRYPSEYPAISVVAELSQRFVDTL